MITESKEKQMKETLSLRSKIKQINDKRIRNDRSIQNTSKRPLVGKSLGGKDDNEEKG
jgi:hypothetical protein